MGFLQTYLIAYTWRRQKYQVLRVMIAILYKASLIIGIAWSSYHTCTGTLIDLSMFFDMLCAKELKMDEVEQIEAQIPITLCKLEKDFSSCIFWYYVTFVYPLGPWS